ncbi:MAG: hypothetical protein IJP90_16170 [Treponema sp.]|nr:hypothetical protein [Treponema sp.]
MLRIYQKIRAQSTGNELSAVPPFGSILPFGRKTPSLQNGSAAATITARHLWDKKDCHP